jgi:transcriptional regulator with XRE-family HTH domain
MGQSGKALKSQRLAQKAELRDEPAVEPAIAEILLGRKIKQARTSKGMRLRELAERVELSESLLSKLENEKAIPSLSSLHRIAIALDTNVSWFFSGESDRGQIVTRKGERPTIRSNSERATIENIVPYGR